MGYAGEESMYVSRAVLNAAYSDNGLALDFYKSSFVITGPHSSYPACVVLL